MALNTSNIEAEIERLVRAYAPVSSSEIERNRYGLAVRLSHPLSSGLGCAWTHEQLPDPDLSRFEHDLKADTELHDIRHAPEAANPDLVRLVQTLAKIHRWSSLACHSLAWGLYDQNLLNWDEAKWLGAFTGEGAPRKIQTGPD